MPNGIDDEDGETYDINNESYFAFQENPNPVFSATEHSVFVCGEKVSWLSEGSDDPACTGGALGGEYGWHHGGKQLFFGTIGLLLSGGTLAAGGLTAYGVAFETGNVILNVDDISMGIFADGETSFLTKLGLDNSVVEKLKFCGDATGFLKGLMGELQGVISSMEEVARTGKMTESQLEVWNAANIAFDQLQTLLGGYELLEPEKK